MELLQYKLAVLSSLLNDPEASYIVGSMLEMQSLRKEINYSFKV